MSIREEIDKAIAAHGQWKHKLRTAIDTGQSESTPEKVKMDYNCSFGKWLHNRIDSNNKQSEFYPIVVDLHASFHKEAGAILEMALNGSPDVASAKLGFGSEFSKYSALLTKTMKQWQDSL